MNALKSGNDHRDMNLGYENYLYVGNKLEKAFFDQLESYICYKGGTIFYAADNTAARVIIENNPIKVVLVDQFLDNCSGIEFMRWMFSFAYIPTILVIFEKDSFPFETVVSLEAGAADAISVDISVRELAARIKACNRKRVSSGHTLFTDKHGLVPGQIKTFHRRPLYYMPETRRLYFSDSSRTVLHGKESELLYLLMTRYPDFVTRTEISKQVFQREWNPRDRSIDNLISRLRKNIDMEESDYDESIIETVRNEGYKLRLPIDLLTPEQYQRLVDSF